MADPSPTDLAAIAKAIDDAYDVSLEGEITNLDAVALAAWNAIQALPRRAKEVRVTRNG